MNESWKDQRITELEEENAALKARVADLEAQLADVLEKLALLQKMHFGRSSEKSKTSTTTQKKNEEEREALTQGCAANDTVDNNATDNPDAQSNKRTATSSRPKGGGRKALPDHLPRVKNILSAGSCPNGCCEAPENILCEHTCERLAVIPAIYYVIQDIRQVATYPCDSDKAVTAKAEPCLLPRTQVTPELLAHIAISKVLDGLPLYRQEQQASRFNCPIPRDKLTRWFIALGSQLKAFVDMLVAHYNEHDVGGIDETGIQVIKEAGRTAEQKSYLFTRYGGSSTQPVMIVNYRQRKDYATVKAILEDFESGHIVSDMNPSYIRFAKYHAEVTLNACHDHARRKFDAALALIPKNKREGSFPERILQLYGQIYAVEKEVKRRSPRVIKRKRKRARKFLNRIYRLIDQQAFRPTSKLGDACQYALNHKQALYSYIDKPVVPISNIMSEHIAKKIAVARKNFLFCYSESGAHAIANVMSVVYTSDLYKDHNLHDYLTALFLELPKVTTMDDLEALLPWNFTPSQVANIVAARPRPTINGEPIAHAA